MIRRTIPVAVAGILAIALAIGGLSASDKGPDLPELSLEKPAVGLQMECRQFNAGYTVGDYVIISCTITNVSDKTKPITWNPRIGNFCQQNGHDLIPGGAVRIGYPEIRHPLVTKSWWAHPDNYILSPPPRAKLTFRVHIGKAEKPEQFSGRINYDPLPTRGGFVAMGDGFRWQDEYVFSAPFTYEVVDKAAGSATDRLEDGT